MAKIKVDAPKGKSNVERAKELANAVNKAIGATEAVVMGSHEKFVVDFIPTGVEPIDVLLQGGLPRGRFTMLTGDFSTLKSLIGYSAIAQVQQAGGIAALIDTEHSYEAAWGKSLGIDNDALIIEHPETGELAIDTAEALIRSRACDLVVFDSVAATVPEAESSKRLHGENIQPARIAALMSAACRRLTAANHKTAVLWINQIREKVGVMFGSPEKITGGRALPYYSSYIVNLKKVGKITRDVKMFAGGKFNTVKEQTGQQFKAELTKSKLSKPFREVWFDYSLTASQIDLLGFCINQAVDEGLIKITNKSWVYRNIKAVGKDNFKKKMQDNPAVARELRKDVRDLHGLAALPEAVQRTTPAKKTTAKKPKALKRK